MPERRPTDHSSRFENYSGIFDRYDIVDEEDLRQAALRHTEHVQNLATTATVAEVKRA